MWLAVRAAIKKLSQIEKEPQSSFSLFHQTLRTILNSAKNLSVHADGMKDVALVKD
jgi:hypothetical protein